MKLTIERAALLRTLAHAQSVVERRNTIPVLSNVLLDATGTALVISSTDLDIQVRETVAASIETKGRTTVSAHTFHDIVRKMPEGSLIEIDVQGGRMRLVGGRARFELPVLPAEDFPEIAVGDLPVSFVVPADEIARMIRTARPSISTEETRYYLNGIYVHPTHDGDRLRFVSTDGHRLALVSTPSPADGGAFDGIIVPRKCVAEIARVIDDFAGTDIGVSLSKSKIRFDFGDLVYVSKLVDGTFPDYTRVIPTQNSLVAGIDADSLAEAIDRVSTIASEKTRAVKFVLDSDRIQLSVTSPDNGTATEEIAADYSGKPLEIGFNSRYLLDILTLLSGQQIEMHFADATAPTLVKLKDSDDSFTIMPMRT